MPAEEPQEPEGGVWARGELLSWEGSSLQIEYCEGTRAQGGESFVGWGRSSWGLFISGSVALWGKKPCAKYTQKSSQNSFLERVCIEMGNAKLEKQEEACEILCSCAGCQAVGGLWHVILHGLLPPDPSSLEV